MRFGIFVLGLELKVYVLPEIEVEMQRFVAKIVELMRQEKLIMLQVCLYKTPSIFTRHTN